MALIPLVIYIFKMTVKLEAGLLGDEAEHLLGLRVNTERYEGKCLTDSDPRTAKRSRSAGSDSIC